jgi:hypothetical protein
VGEFYKKKTQDLSIFFDYLVELRVSFNDFVM